MKVLLFLILLILLILLFLELGMLFLLRFPTVLRKCSRKLQNSISHLYISGERKIMQFLEGCGQYHLELGYTFKPGKFLFAEREYSNEYNINSLGVRDSEEALFKPQIIVVGDSYALGWGVNQDETFAKLVEKKTKLKTLNTAIPSYGTVREMIMLRHVDRSELRCLIIQYCGDDYDENMRYYLNGKKPQIMRKETFQELVEKLSIPKKYFIGKNLRLKIEKKIREFRQRQMPATVTPSISDVDLFLHVLRYNEEILRSLPIIVLEMSGKNQTNLFPSLLKNKITDGNYPDYIQNMVILDLTKYLNEKHFYVLDDHVTAEGHIIIADLLYSILEDKKIV